MWILDIFDCISLRLVSFGTILLLVGLIGQSQTAPPESSRQGGKAPDITLDISFAVRGIIGKIYIVASTKHHQPIIGVLESNDTGLVFNHGKNDNVYKQVFQSETQEGTEDGVEFQNTHTIKYTFSSILPYKVDVFRDDGFDDPSFVGTAFTDIADIARHKQVVKYLSVEEWVEEMKYKWVRGDGVLVIESHENLTGCKDLEAFNMKGQMFEQYDSMYPYVILSRQISDDPVVWEEIDKTSMIGFGNTAKPQFRPLSVRKSNVTAEENEELQLKFTCMVRDLDNLKNKDIELGEFQTSFWELQEGETFPCVKEGDKNEKNLITIGTFVTVPTFLQIIQSNIKIEAHVAIDFTISNQQQQTHLGKYGMHEVQSTGDLNYYEQAIISIIPTIEHYDTDKQIPLTGFGARIPGEGKPNHFFYLGPFMNKGNNCQGTMQLLQIYRYVMLNKKFKLASPTNYADTIAHIVDEACGKHKGKNDAFFLLVMLVDGKYNDKQATKAQIAIGSECPMSIILVGIGDKYTEFDDLIELDADHGEPLVGKDKNGERHVAVADIVQHVAYNKLFIDYPTLPDAMDALTREILAEFPTHVQNYFKMHNLKVNPLPQGVESIQTVEPTPVAVQTFSELLNIFDYQDHCEVAF